MGFLREVDGVLSRSMEVRCLGAFVLFILWELPRQTGDIDFIEVVPSEAAGELLRMAGKGSDIARTYKVHFDRAAVAEYPEGYASRLTDLTPRGLKRLRLLALDVHDLALAKLGRNSARDRADVRFLVARGAVDRRVLEERFTSELLPHVLNEKRHADAFELWLDEFFNAGASKTDRS